MTSMFDQYNKTLTREETSESRAPSMMKSSGYVSVRTKEETPIFAKQKMKIDLPHDIVHMRICNNWLVTLMSHQVLLRLYLLQPDRQDEVHLEKYMTGLRVSNVFFDPTGNHLLIALTIKCSGFAPELLYLHRRSSRPKKVERFRDHEITAVAFNPKNQSETSTGSILIGTSKGLLFETELSVDGDKMVQNYWKQVFDIGRGEHCPITGIEFHNVPNTGRYIVLVSTLTRIYNFHEVINDERPPYLQQIFNSYLNVPEDQRDFHSINNKLKYSRLRVNVDRQTRFPKYFGWLTDAGVYSGEIDQQAATPQFIVTQEIIPFPEPEPLNVDTEASSSAHDKRPDYPITMVLTDFHVLLLYSDHITAVSTLNYRIVYEEYFPENVGKLLNITKDQSSGTIYACSRRNIFRYKVSNERRDVWFMYLEKGDFDLAKACSVDNPAHLDIVLTKQAENLFARKEYTQSAEIFAQTKTSFEDICLRFLEINEIESLLVFLRNRLDTLKAQDKTQITMLVVWIVELYLTQMSQTVLNKEFDKNRALQTQLSAFLALPRVIECIRNNRGVIYDLMASHGDDFNLSTLTKVNKDYESVIDQHLIQGKHGDALTVLRSLNRDDLFYKYASVLMQSVPKDTISAIIKFGQRLDPIRLLPAFVDLETGEQRNETIRYLEYCIHSNGCVEQAIHNFFIRLSAQLNRNDQLMTYLEWQGKDISLIQYDVHYALRVCTEFGLKPACVFLKCMLELWHPAVELALTIDTKLAQRTASQPSDRDLRRKLWLMIAEHEIKAKNDVAEALELLKECDLLRIEDLLPFFGDFEKIDHFKEAICDALKEYNAKIQEQRRDMEEASNAADHVRKELQTFRNRSITIDGQEKCACCDVYLLVKPFFLFQCGHKFHRDCLEENIVEYLNFDEMRRLAQLKTEQSDILNVSGERRDQVKVEIESILAAECLFCGEHMINSIDKPFIADWKRADLDWQ